MKIKGKCPWCNTEFSNSNKFHYTGICVFCAAKIANIAANVVEDNRENMGDCIFMCEKHGQDYRLKCKTCVRVNKINLNNSKPIDKNSGLH